MNGSRKKTIILSVLFVLLAIIAGYFYWLSSELISFAFNYRRLVAEEIRSSNLSTSAQESLIESIREKAPRIRGFEVGTSDSSAAFMWSD